MEALSPRSVNLPPRASKYIQKARVVSTKQDGAPGQQKHHPKHKDFPPEPPPVVYEPILDNGVGGEQYTIKGLLGKGGFALCYSGQLKRDPSRVFALKMVKTNFSTMKLQDKFRTELQIHSKMYHPNIVEFYRAFTFNATTYVVLELCSNGSVMDMVKKRGYLSLPEVRRLTIQMCGAIKYMHQKNVIHRDLKMGNLFLDKDMNVKIGDFGLAALIVTDADVKGANRRTTMCGTPNYIAPEILSRETGHGHKVDIWAIGIIVFAMLTGRPPFQSSTSVEIYERVKNLDYDWPKETSDTNHIPPEVRHFVSTLLQVRAEDRPEADAIVMHPFFNMHPGCVAPVLSPSCRKEKPSWLLKGKPQGDSIKKNCGMNRDVLLEQCGVGIPSGLNSPAVYPCKGVDVGVSLFTRINEETAAGFMPILPLTDDTVYQSYLIRGDWLQQSGSAFVGPPSKMHRSRRRPKQEIIIAEDQDAEPKQKPSMVPGAWPSSSPAKTEEGSLNNHPLKLLDDVKLQNHLADLKIRRSNPQSHAAMLRQQSVKTANRPNGLLGADPIRSRARSATHAAPVIKERSPERPQPAKPGMSLRNRQIRPLLNPSEKMGNELAISKRPQSVRMMRSVTTSSLSSYEKSASMSKTVEPIRHASDADKTNSLRPRRVVSRVASSPHLSSSVLISPRENIEVLRDSDARSVKGKLQFLAHKLDSALSETNNKSWGKGVRKTTTARFASQPVVTKWVDYTNKFGIGYILRDGSVGCLFLPHSHRSKNPTCVIVRKGEEHLQKRKLANYSQADFLVPKNGPPIEFYENCGDDGFKRVCVSPKSLPIEDLSRTNSSSNVHFSSVYEAEKTKSLWMWDKFAQYMSKALGEGKDESDSDRLQRDAPWVRFYERVGNVGIWAFGDGTLQINFPDHTKLVLSGDGSICDLYYLRPETARYLRETGRLLDDALAARGSLSDSLDSLCSSRQRDPEIFEILETNEFRKKLEFVLVIIKRWLSNGGLGNGCRDEDLFYKGTMEKQRWAEKRVWTTVGALGGDGRMVCPGGERRDA
ncbi:MAG: Cell cycle serine/threonine-protein kinase cdc5/MSD2 [Cirrosporium novae-zelandiae]|nr:MAG: Cell cycle serine/threonine-protein kinase cdc5/MSD2 [Cirrosporium novae-zelandiae]